MDKGCGERSNYNTHGEQIYVSIKVKGHLLCISCHLMGNGAIYLFHYVIIRINKCVRILSETVGGGILVSIHS